VKRPRTVRSKRPPVALTDRDLDVLTLIGLARFATTDQVARDLFPSEDRARRRLRQLFDARLLAVTLTSSTSPNLVSLTAEGLDLLKGQRPELAKRVRRTGVIKLSEIERHLLLVDVRLYAAALGGLRGTPLARWTNDPATELQRLGSSTAGVVPAAIAEFAVELRAVRVAVELDARAPSIEPLGRRLARYPQLAALGTLDALWIATVGGKERERDLDRLLHEHRLSAWVRVIPRAQLVARPVRELPTRRLASPDECAHADLTHA